MAISSSELEPAGRGRLTQPPDWDNHVEKRRRINGIIFSDLGQAAGFMALEWVQGSLQKSLGYRPYAATLNLRLQTKNDIDTWMQIQREIRGLDVPPPDPGFCHARLFRVEIEAPNDRGQKKLCGAVLLPEVPGYPQDKVEIVAPVRLKDELQVRDGDQLSLEFAD